MRFLSSKPTDASPPLPAVSVSRDWKVVIIYTLNCTNVLHAYAMVDLAVAQWPSFSLGGWHLTQLAGTSAADGTVRHGTAAVVNMVCVSACAEVAAAVAVAAPGVYRVGVLSVGYCYHTGGLTLDSSLTFTAYISNIWRKSHFHVRAPSYIKNCLMEDDAKTVCSAVVNCNWLLQLSLRDFQRQHQQATTDTEYSCSCCFRCQPLVSSWQRQANCFPRVWS